MKSRKIIVEVICFILLMNFFYEGVYKLIYWQDYIFWVKHAPLLSPVWWLFAYTIPVGEIMLGLSYLKTSFRLKAFYITIGMMIIYVLWVMSACLFTNRFFWPYHAFWAKPTWIQKMLFSLGISWLVFWAIFLSKSYFSMKRDRLNALRNKPVSAS